ncbi:hypothetical protein [Bacillus sp. 7884-1]|uniref:hypothetical protein n=1 Tax=Bacillus sp. 7884-1 TaxID=2021693 RepID=UPI000BA6BA5D|nr:hypothetical protein [Bacillus sp. 7884-1]PAE37599.1 hypothetical protein CHI06_20025 [Bacillus sp. 7884-1]
MHVPITINNRDIKLQNDEFQSFTFKELGIQESDIEEFLSDNLQLLVDEEETLLLIGQQIQNTQRGRSDLVAIDNQGNLVLIEIKRDIEDIRNRKEPFEFQAIRYAANYAKINDIDDVINKIYAPYLEKKGKVTHEALTSSEQARRMINEFLTDNDAIRNFNKKQRIILVASQFDEQTLSACAWLINNHVDITCITVEPKKFKDQFFLEVDRLLPVPSLADFYVEVGNTATPSQMRLSTSKISNRSLPKMPQLFEWGIMQANQEIYIKKYPEQKAKVVDENTVIYQNETMSYNDFGKKVTGWSSLSVYEWLVVEGQMQTLHELRLEKLEKINQLENQG